MAYDEGFNFRATSAYVTDPTDTQFVDATTTYPTTANGATFGWDMSLGTAERDRSTGVDARLAGIHFVAEGSAARTFQVDLPSTGDYEIRCALGDQGSAQTGMSVDLKDDSTTFATPGGDSSAAQWYDATDVLRIGSATWVSSNAAVTRTFTSTVFKAVLNPGTAGAASALAHLRITLVSAPAISRLLLLGVS